MTFEKKEVVVYWAPFTNPDKQTLMNLLVEPPVPLRRLLSTNAGHDTKNSYKACPASTDMWSNVYALMHPRTSTATVSGDLNSPIFTTENDAPWIPYTSALDGYRLDYDHSWIFFCEESLMMQQMPPFMHNTSERTGGRIAAGAFNIGKWFRAVNLSYLLWPESTSITVTKDEPAAYIQFHTDKKVVLKQFEYTSEMHALVHQALSYKTLSPYETLQSMYDRFTRSNRHKRVLKLIKDNLLE